MNQDEFKRVYNENRNGCNYFVRHPLMPSFAYSDGVQDLADTGCYWLLDILSTELPAEFRKNEEVANSCIVTATVKAGKVDLTAEFEDGVVAWSRKDIWTDMPAGEWKINVADQGPEVDARYRAILLSEY